MNLFDDDADFVTACAEPMAGLIAGETTPGAEVTDDAAIEKEGDAA